ncbi:MAG: DMT family transporter [Phycisphaeraceae bacterium]|nr:MAG: DMT family transporter [Phycisphaeraceae bacterium]
MKPILFAVLAGLCWGVGEIFTKSALNTKTVGPLTALFVRSAVTLVPAVLAYALAAHVWRTAGEPADWYARAPLSVWLKLILGSGVLVGFCGVFFFYYGLSLPGGEISLLRPIAFGLAPATAVLLGWLMLGEGVSWVKGLACAMIIGGIVLLGADHGKKTREEAARVKQGEAVARGV